MFIQEIIWEQQEIFLDFVREGLAYGIGAVIIYYICAILGKCVLDYLRNKK